MPSAPVFSKIIRLAWITCLLTSASLIAKADDNRDLEIGYEHAELSQNKYRNLGPSNYTFFVGKKFDSIALKDWAWRLSFINVELSNEHLRDEDNVCCIKGDRSNLEGNLVQHRLYLDYLPYTVSWTSAKKIIGVKFLASIGIGYNRWITRDFVTKEKHDVKAVTAGGLFKFRTTLFERFFVEPAIDLGFIVHKNKNVNTTIGGARLDRPEYYTVTLLIHLGYKF